MIGQGEDVKAPWVDAAPADPTLSTTSNSKVTPQRMRPVAIESEFVKVVLLESKQSAVRLSGRTPSKPSNEKGTRRNQTPQTMRHLPWDTENVATRSGHRMKLLILGLCLLTCFALVLGLALGLGRSSRPSPGFSKNETVLIPDKVDANEFLADHSLYHNLRFVIQDASMLEAESSMVINAILDVKLSWSSRRLDARDTLPMFTTGEEVEIAFETSSAGNIALRFGGSDQNGSLRVLGLTPKSTLKITLPIDCVESLPCSRIRLYLFLVSADVRRISANPAMIEFGWVCPNSSSVSCSSDSCRNMIETCLSPPPIDKRAEFDKCLRQFSFDSMALRAVIDQDCYAMNVLQTVALQCSQLVTGNLHDWLEAERVEVGMMRTIPCNDRALVFMQSCPALSCEISLAALRYRAQVAAPPIMAPSPQPTRLPTTEIKTESSRSPSMPLTNHPTVTNTKSPSNVVVSRTRSPSSFCDAGCTCPQADPCCCNDGQCAPDKCPDTFVRR